MMGGGRGLERGCRAGGSGPASARAALGLPLRGGARRHTLHAIPTSAAVAADIAERRR